MTPLILPSFSWFIQLLVFARFATLRCSPWPPKTTSRSSRRASQRHNRNAHHLAPLDVILLLRPTVPLFQLSGDLFIWPPSIVATHLGLYAHLDSTEIANDAAVNISTYHAVELRCAIATVSSTALPSGTTNVLSTATTSSWIHNTATIHYYLAEITLTNHTTLSFSDQQRLSSSSLRDPSYATLEAGRGLSRHREGERHRLSGYSTFQQILAVQGH